MTLVVRLNSLRKRWKFWALRRDCTASGIDSVVLRYRDWRVEVQIDSDLAPRIARGAYETDHEQALASLVRRGDSCIDVGANIGLISLELARLTGLTGTVLSFEPEPTAFRILLANLARNAVSPVRSFNLAASDKVGVSTLQSPAGRAEYATLASLVHPSAHAGKRVSIQVMVDSLDRVALPLLNDCRLLKLDTEGHELHVLMGSALLISRWRPHISLEIVPKLLESHGSTTDGVLDWLSERSYSLRDLSGARLVRSRLGLNGYHQFIAEPC